jgi:hypothetical protein
MINEEEFKEVNILIDYLSIKSQSLLRTAETIHIPSIYKVLCKLSKKDEREYIRILEYLHAGIYNTQQTLLSLLLTQHALLYDLKEHYRPENVLKKLTEDEEDEEK